MIVARWHIQAKFGRKQVVLDSIRTWQREIGAQAGMPPQRLLSTSLGGRESEIEAEVELRELSELQAIFDKLATLPAHAEWSRKLEPEMISGSTYWTIHRVVD